MNSIPLLTLALQRPAVDPNAARDEFLGTIAGLVFGALIALWIARKLRARK